MCSSDLEVVQLGVRVLVPARWTRRTHGKLGDPGGQFGGGRAVGAEERPPLHEPLTGVRPGLGLAVLDPPDDGVELVHAPTVAGDQDVTSV